MLWFLLNLTSKSSFWIRISSDTNKGRFKVWRLRFLSQDQVQEQNSFVLSFIFTGHIWIQLEHFYYNKTIRDLYFDIYLQSNADHVVGIKANTITLFIITDQIMNSTWNTNTNRRHTIHFCFFNESLLNRYTGHLVEIRGANQN